MKLELEGMPGARRPARARSSRRRPDHRPHRPRVAQGGDGAAAAAAPHRLAVGAWRGSRSPRRRRLVQTCSSGWRAPRRGGPPLAAGCSAWPRSQACAATREGGGGPARYPGRCSLSGSTPSLVLDAPAVVVCAYGLLFPTSCWRADLAQRPSVASAALARCGAGRARDPGRRHRDGRHDPPNDEGAGRRARRGPTGVPDRAEDDAGAVFARAAELAAELLG